MVAGGSGFVNLRIGSTWDFEMVARECPRASRHFGFCTNSLVKASRAVYFGITYRHEPANRYISMASLTSWLSGTLSKSRVRMRSRAARLLPSPT